jgi:hypothetical protein
VTTDKLNPSIRRSLLSRRRTLLRGLLVDLRPVRARQMQTQIDTVRKKYEEQNSTVKPEKARSQK